MPKLRTGPSSTGHKIGVYCEGEHRKECAHHYCVYFGITIEPLPDENRDPESMFTVFLALEVDRNVRTQVNNRWVQPEGSLVVSGTWVHGTSLVDMRLGGIHGHFSVANCWIR